MSLVSQQLFNRIEQYGSAAEVALFQRWRDEIDQFLGPVDKHLISGQQLLEVGIENRMTLKLNLLTSLIPPYATLNTLFTDPCFEPWRSLILEHDMRFYTGIKVNPEGISKEIYLYEKNDILAQQGQLTPQIFNLPEGKVPVAYGISDDGSTSAYYPSSDTARLDIVAQKLQFPIASQARNVWDHVRKKNDTIVQAKMGILLKKPTPSLIQRFCNNFHLPHFQYLMPPLHTIHSCNFGISPDFKHHGIYFTYPKGLGLNPLAKQRHVLHYE